MPYLNLIKQDGSDKIISHLVLFPKLWTVNLNYAKVKGTPFSKCDDSALFCSVNCAEALFCDVCSCAEQANYCFMYAINDITNIVIANDNSFVALMGLR